MSCFITGKLGGGGGYLPIFSLDSHQILCVLGLILTYVAKTCHHVLSLLTINDKKRKKDKLARIHGSLVEPL